MAPVNRHAATTTCSERQDTTNIAPGTRILVREEEWLMRRVDRASSGKVCFHGDWALAVVDPTKTVPVADTSPFHRGGHVCTLRRC